MSTRRIHSPYCPEDTRSVCHSDQSRRAQRRATAKHRQFVMARVYAQRKKNRKATKQNTQLREKGGTAAAAEAPAATSCIPFSAESTLSAFVKTEVGLARCGAHATAFIKCIMCCHTTPARGEIERDDRSLFVCLSLPSLPAAHDTSSTFFACDIASLFCFVLVGDGAVRVLLFFHCVGCVYCGFFMRTTKPGALFDSVRGETGPFASRCTSCRCGFLIAMRIFPFATKTHPAPFW